MQQSIKRQLVVFIPWNVPVRFVNQLKLKGSCAASVKHRSLGDSHETVKFALHDATVLLAMIDVEVTHSVTKGTPLGFPVVGFPIFTICPSTPVVLMPLYAHP